jgi:hypothetical protein
MLAGYNKEISTIIVQAGSAASGTTTIPVLIAPYGGITITRAWFQAVGSVAASGTNYVTANLFDAGAAGTATTSIGTAGGTAGVADGPIAMTVSTNNLDAGDFLMAKVGKIGTITEREYAFVVEWVHGQG